MSVPSINIVANIAETIRAIDDIQKRTREEAQRLQDKTLAELKQQVEIAFSVIYTLEDMFIQILRHFRNPKITENAEALQELLNQTNMLLESRRLLPYLDMATEAIKAAASSPRFEVPDYEDLVNDLQELYPKLEQWRLALGPRGLTAPGIWQLFELRRLAELQLDTLQSDASDTAEDAGVSSSSPVIGEARMKVPADESLRQENVSARRIAEVANQAYNDYNWALSTDIWKLIGRLPISS